MRMTDRLAMISALLMIGLAGCNGVGNSSGGADAVGGGSARQAALDEQIEGCVNSARQAGQLPPGVDLQAVCGCAINRVTEGKSDEEVRAIFSRAPNEAEMAITRGCMLEAVQGAAKK